MPIISQFWWGNIFSLDSKLHKLTVICTVSISKVHLAVLIFGLWTLISIRKSSFVRINCCTLAYLCLISSEVKQRKCFCSSFIKYCFSFLLPILLTSSAEVEKQNSILTSVYCFDQCNSGHPHCMFLPTSAGADKVLLKL